VGLPLALRRGGPASPRGLVAARPAADMAGALADPGQPRANLGVSPVFFEIPSQNDRDVLRSCGGVCDLWCHQPSRNCL
jgi:hypothetical protein